MGVSVTIDHVHDFHPHHHVTTADGKPFCSARYWCGTCRQWITGKPCKGTIRAVLPR